jgi:hypothetical protein
MSRLRRIYSDANVVAHVFAISAMLFVGLVALGVWGPERLHPTVSASMPTP